MTGKKQLEDIKERVLVDRVYYKYLDGTKGHWGKTYTLDEEDYKYLYEQAERVQVLEKKLENVMDRHTYLEGDYYNLQEQNKRYREAIEVAIRNMTASGNLGVKFALRILEQALEGEGNA